MDLAEVSHNINLVKKDNAKWLRYAHDLIEGNSLPKDAIPKYKDDCLACYWLYDHSGEVNQYYQTQEQDELNLFNFDTMEQVVILRYDLHEQYLSIFKTFLPELNHSFFANLFRGEHTLSAEDVKRAKQSLLEMKKLVIVLEKKLSILEASLLDLCKLNIA